MPTVLAFVFNLLRAFVSFLRTIMFLRAILSWFPAGRESRFSEFCFVVTEPIIAPVRAILSHFRYFDGMPFDIAFFITFIILSML
ncbi:MAG: YggT family protein [Clostridia bacterium]|nr:YggT family protein [Clostridia bacterium]